MNNDIGHLKNIKEVVSSKKKQLDEANNRMKVNRDQIDKYNNTLQPIIERLNMIHAREGDISKLYTEKGMCVCFCFYVYLSFNLLL
jgi:DNA repair exonuclease SbcCD ATPase subunit